MDSAKKDAPERQEIPLFIRLDETPIGRTRNLSSSGIFLLTDERPPVDSRHELSLAWGTDVVSCMARVVRHADDGIGLTFEHPDDLFAHAVQEILADQRAGSV